MAPTWTRHIKPFLTRLLIVAFGMVAWFATQAILGQRLVNPDDPISDGIFLLTEQINKYLNENKAVAHGLLIATSVVIDCVVTFMIAISIFGKTMRPFIAMIILFTCRQVCQMVCSLPPPEGMIWEYPGFPALFVTYDVTNDLFFSGHTAMAVLGGLEIASYGGFFVPLGYILIAFETITVLLLKAHYTMDVYTGFITALWTYSLGEKLAPVLDRIGQPEAAHQKKKAVIAAEEKQN
ncbi:putative phosphatase PAP2 family protein [Paratrimastix pyriformis]|uniref:Phosphatase PAP2 family protein n=1 Tax=Paratrimastix pyriformis TaxID=342808 RepID=A0ABQ8UQH2_9EUKA|nr:putative phosphatase PAP2 family protein [Paratrimastix pyriformis]|eukprot:GAFH01003934.1.p1 GENE.GAFH01003934.1~~GAFH01003934.1.p1  ORF type:complete len:246 (-),score=66.33 GAFH01003934.1:125-835(-)